jgi:hypothetical protein
VIVAFVDSEADLCRADACFPGCVVALHMYSASPGSAYPVVVAADSHPTAKYLGHTNSYDPSRRGMLHAVEPF